jgi:hypothetical protein
LERAGNLGEAERRKNLGMNFTTEASLPRKDRMPKLGTMALSLQSARIAQFFKEFSK